MITGRRSFHTAALASAILIIPAVAAGQTGTGPVRIGGLISGSAGAGNSALTLGASASFRLTSKLSVEGDLSHFSDLTLAEFPGVAPNSRASFHARATAATVNAVFDLPAGVRWLRPYVAAGGGAAFVRRETQGLSGAATRATPRYAPGIERRRRRRLSPRARRRGRSRLPLSADLRRRAQLPAEPPQPQAGRLVRQLSASRAVFEFSVDVGTDGFT